MDLLRPNNDSSSIKVATAVFMQWLSQTWVSHFSKQDRSPLTVFHVRSPEELRSLRPQLDGKPLQFPFAMITWLSLGLDDRKAAAAQRSRPPVVIDRSRQNSHVTLAVNIPIKLGLGLQFRSDNLEQVVDFANLYLTHSPIFAMELIDNNTGVLENYTVNLEPELSIPAQGEKSEFRFESTVSINCSLSRTHDQGVIKEIRLSVYNQHSLYDQWSFSGLDNLVTDAYRYTELFDTQNPRYKGD